VTLIELLLVISILGILSVIMIPHIRSGRQVWQVVGDRHADVLQNARIGIDKMTRMIRQAKSISEAGSSYVEFVDNDDTSWRFQHNNNHLEYGQPDNLSTLSGPISSISITYFKEDGTTQTTEPEEIKSVLIQMTTTDSEGIVEDITLTSLALIRRDAPQHGAVVINEIMYNPYTLIGGDNQWEWVELYNDAEQEANVTNWTLNNESIEHAAGPLSISAGGYATITKRESSIYNLFLNMLPPNVTQLHIDGNGSLNDNGDTVVIKDITGETIDSVTYDDSWGGDGNGRSLQRMDSQGGSNDPDNWVEASQLWFRFWFIIIIYGSPGAAN
jgi:type II secretory pathway pseudopilin PulG